jgi:RNA polymerase sigma factor for flagellar operon FliA
LPPQLSINDLISVGIVGLLDALQRYEEGRVKLSTFVEHRIRGAMLDELRAQSWMPRSTKKKVDSIRKAHQQMEQELGRPPEDWEVTKKLGLSLDEYHRTLQDAHNAVTFSFEDFTMHADDDGEMDVKVCLPDPDAKTPLDILEENSEKDRLAALIGVLPEKGQLVLSLYYWGGLTMKGIGKVLGVTEGRVCQLHNQALVRLKARLDTDA